MVNSSINAVKSSREVTNSLIISYLRSVRDTRDYHFPIRGESTIKQKIMINLLATVATEAALHKMDEIKIG